MNRSSCQIPWTRPAPWPPVDWETDHAANFIICAGAIFGMVSVRALFLLALALAGACSVSVSDPYSGGLCPYSDHEIHEFAAATERAFAENYGSVPAGITDGVLVSCRPTQCLNEEGDTGGCIAGMAPSDSHVVIATQYAHGEPIPIGYTALAHELVHVILERSTGDADGDHESEAFDGVDHIMRQRALRYERPDLFCARR